MLTVKAAADRLGVSAALVYGWVSAGVLAHYRVGLPGTRGAIRIAEADLDAFLAGCRREEQKPVAPAPPKPVSLRHLRATS